MGTQFILLIVCHHRFKSFIFWLHLMSCQQNCVWICIEMIQWISSELSFIFYSTIAKSNITSLFSIWLNKMWLQNWNRKDLISLYIPFLWDTQKIVVVVVEVAIFLSIYGSQARFCPRLECTLMDIIYHIADFQKNILIVLTAFPLELKNKWYLIWKPL